MDWKIIKQALVVVGIVVGCGIMFFLIFNRWN